MNFTQAFEIYQIRWNIEVMIKECKSYLGPAEKAMILYKSVYYM
jgi:hypothetical protein